MDLSSEMLKYETSPLFVFLWEAISFPTSAEKSVQIGHYAYTFYNFSWTQKLWSYTHLQDYPKPLTSNLMITLHNMFQEALF